MNLGIPHLPALPLLGNLASVIFRRKNLIDVIIEAYNCDPDAKYVGFFTFTQPILLIRDLELIKNLTIKDFDHFPDHKPLADPELDPLFGNNLFSMTGDRWKDVRHLLSPAFTSSKIKTMFELMVPCAKTFLTYVDQLSEPEKTMLNTKDLFTKYTNDVIATCAFGIQVDSLNSPENDFYVLGKKATNFEGAMGRKMILSRLAPGLFKLLKLRLIDDRTENFFKDVVKQTVKTREERGITRPDMIQLMMDSKKLDLDDMTAQAFVFFVAGFETTSTQMCLIAHMLAIYPEVQKRLQREVDEVKDVTYEAINSMTYMDAVFNETMRRYPQVPMLDRVCAKGYELPPAKPGLKPYKLRPGDVVWIPAPGVHMDDRHFEEPEKFYPERFLDKKVGVNQTTSLGFGIGPRSCIGNRFAVLETKALIFHLLTRYNFRKNNKTCDPFEYEPATVSKRPKGGFWVALEKRS